MMRFFLALIFAGFVTAANAQAPNTTKPSFTDMLMANCNATHMLIGGATTPACGPSPTRAGDLMYYNGTTWVSLAGNNSGTQILQETAAGVPSWATVAGSGTVTSVVCAATTITTTGTCYSAGQVVGTATNDNATAGNFGEYISSVIPIGSATAFSNGVTGNVTSVSLTAGDWDVSGVAYTTNPGTTVITFLEIAVSPTSATLPTRAVASGVVSAGSNVFQNFGGSSGLNESIASAPVRVSVASTTTIYLVLNPTFTTSTLSIYGVMRARRVR